MKIDFYFNEQFTHSHEESSELLRLPIPAPTQAGLFEIRFSIPILDMQSYWMPECRVPSSKLHWRIECNSAAQRYFPFLSFFNLEQENRCSVAVSNLYDDCRIRAFMNQERGTYDLCISICVTPQSGSFELLVDRRKLLWTECLTQYRQQLNIALPKFPAGAWQAVYCTWYAVHASVTQDWVEENAALAAKLGFGTLIIDDGWCFDVMKRVTPQALTDWYEHIGDWEVSKSKFPDFENHVQRVRAMGLNYLLWVSPFLIGARSQLYQEIKQACSTTYHEGYHLLNVKEKEVAEKVLNKIVRLLEIYPIDGLKIDFLDQYWPDISEPRGRATLDFIANMSSRIRALRPEALIEFRQGYTNLAMLPHATQFRAGDVPFDFLDNLLRLAQIRLSMGDHIPIHADPVYWHPAESDVNISRHMIASLVGVPMLSMQLSGISPREIAIISHWLNFYQEHLELFQKGKWQIRYYQSQLLYVSVTLQKQSIFFVNCANSLPKILQQCSHNMHILNLSAETLQVDNCQSYDCQGEKHQNGCIPPGGRGSVRR
ncbi:MAG: alpha-galactosidase [Oligosphaeraceae bacterium]|nr:alpha-galactosidase [Oligosphaeraceae bacterium]